MRRFTHQARADGELPLAAPASPRLLSETILTGATVSQSRAASRPVSQANTNVDEKGTRMDENEHPKGALLFILIFLLLVVGFWVNTYLRLWMRY